MQQFYTLDEAAEILGLSSEKVKEMARKGDLRAFQDRGTLRFRSQEIDERARALGRGSDPELPLGETVMHASEKAPRRTQAQPPAEDETFLVIDDADVPLGQTPAKAAGHSSSKSGGSRKPSSQPPKSAGPKEPPKAASDSDVRLVLDSSELDFNLSDVGTHTPAKKDPQTRLRNAAGPSDSDVKLDSADKLAEHDVPLGETHRAKTLSDSDIRLEGMGPGESSGKHEPIITEDIDLDAEAAKSGGETIERHSPKTRLPSPPPLPTSSPFELSGPDLASHKGGKSTKGPKAPAKSGVESSEDFELKPSKEDDSSPLILGSSEMDLALENGGELTSAFNLEDEKKKDAAKAKPKLPGKHDVDSSSEFEISLDDSDGSSSGSESDSDSEFELSLDVDSSTEMKALDPDVGSDSEFELTLDEAESSSIDEEEKDIFATDFEVPALEDESGSEVAALEESDTDLEGSSEFELSLSEEDVALDSEESGELVEVEESADAAAATVARPRKNLAKSQRATASDEEELEVDLESPDDDIEPLEDEEIAAAPVYASEKPAAWGAMPGVVLIFSTIFLFLGGLLSYELVQNMMGYQTGSPASSMVIKPLARMIDDSIPKD